MVVERVLGAGAKPVDGSAAALFRIAFGLVCLTGVIRFFAHGWVTELYVEPAHHFTYFGLDWVTPWPGWGMHVHFAVLGALALGIAVGFRYRWCALLFFLGFTYVELLDKTNYLNHYYLVSLLALLMVFLPLHQAWSVDRWLAERRGRAAEAPWGRVPAAALWVLRGHVAAVYVFAGIAKLNPDWLLEAQPLRIWLHHHTDLSFVGPLLGEPWVAYAMSWAGALFDLTIVGWLLWRRTRLAAFMVAVVFHVLTWLLFPQIGVFPWLMLGAAVVFFPSDWPKQLASRAGMALRTPGGGRLAEADAPGVRRGDGVWLPRLAAVAVAVYLLVQVAVPLRHYVYTGNVRWNEEGYRFSWRVLLTEKAGLAEYRVWDPESGRWWRAALEEYLTPLQAERAATQPDMVLEVAHIIAADYAKRGYQGVKVYGDVFISMNGRKHQRLIDPSVDLAAMEHGLGPKRWLLDSGTDSVGTHFAKGD